MFLVKLVMMMIRDWVSLFVKAVIVRTGNMSNSLRSNTEGHTGNCWTCSSLYPWNQ